MKDLTQGSIALHVLTMAVPAVITMLVQAAHQIVMLYFVSRIGSDAVASVSAAGNVGFIVGACAQILNVGTLALVAHSAGRADLRDIKFLLNQAFGLSLFCVFATVCILCAAAPAYMRALSQDEVVVDMGVRFLWWVSPAFALLFPMTAISAALRGLGIVSAPMLIYAFTVVLDAALSAILIPGRGWIPAFGVEGAALASTLSMIIGLALMLAYFHRAEPHSAIRGKQLVPRLATWRRIFALGLPAAAELTLVFLSTSAIYFTLRNQGASAQAGFGIGFRIFQLLILPGLAVALAASSIAGQSFGAQSFARVREVFRITALTSIAVMFITTGFVRWQPEALLLLFETDSTSAATAKSFLQIMSWTLVAQGLVYTCTYMFLALGNTLPVLLSATARCVVFSVPALWLSYQDGFHDEQIWYLFAVSIAVQAIGSLWLLQAEFKRKLRLPIRGTGAAVASRNQTIEG